MKMTSFSLQRFLSIWVLHGGWLQTSADVSSSSYCPKLADGHGLLGLAPRPYSFHCVCGMYMMCHCRDCEQLEFWKLRPFYFTG